jgi:hypothetical protein
MPGPKAPAGRWAYPDEGSPTARPSAEPSEQGVH